MTVLCAIRFSLMILGCRRGSTHFPAAVRIYFIHFAFTFRLSCTVLSFLYIARQPMEFTLIAGVFTLNVAQLQQFLGLSR